MKARVLALGALVATAASALPTGASAVATPGRFGPPIAPIGTATRHYFQFPGAALARAGIRYLGPINLGTQKLTFRVTTTMRNQAGLRAYATAANTPGSRYYRQWISPPTIADAFGTPLAQYDATVAYFQSFGLSVKTWKTRTSLTITGSQPQVEAALSTKLGLFQWRGKRFYLASRPVSIPGNVAVSSVSTLTNAPFKHNFAMEGAPPEPVSGSLGNNQVNGYSPEQLADAYNLKTAYTKGYTGKGINLGIIGTGPITPSDGTDFRTLFNVPGTSTITQVNVPMSIDGDTTPPPATGPCSGNLPACNPEDGEAQIDSQQTMSLAIDANILFYLAYNAADGEIGLDLSDDEIDAAIDDNTADILSLSYGGCELLDSVPGEGGLTVVPGSDATGQDPTEFEELAAEGVAVFVSSGDSGSSGCTVLDTPSVEYPSSDPNVVSVGGTNMPITADGRLSGPITSWGQATKFSASGAGLSIDFVTPSFQSAQTSSKSICTMRCLPDVSLDADPNTGVPTLQDTGPGEGGAMIGVYGGTSVAAPHMAAQWAVILSACEQVASCQGPVPPPVTNPDTGFTAPSTIPRYRLGNPNFLLYPLLAKPAVYQAAIYDVVYGNDAVPTYAAQELAAEGGPSAYGTGAIPAVLAPGYTTSGPGFDNDTGLGMPEGYALLKALIPGAN
jgi:subtilase family serine protease